MVRRVILIVPLVIVIAVFVAYEITAGRQMIRSVRFHELSGRQSITRKVIRKIEGGMEEFKRTVGRYPKTKEGFESLMSPKALEPKLRKKWKGPYFTPHVARLKTGHLASGEAVGHLYYKTAIGTFTLHYYAVEREYLITGRFLSPPTAALGKPLHYHSERGYISDSDTRKLKGAPAE